MPIHIRSSGEEDEEGPNDYLATRTSSHAWSSSRKLTTADGGPSKRTACKGNYVILRDYQALD